MNGVRPFVALPDRRAVGTIRPVGDPRPTPSAICDSAALRDQWYVVADGAELDRGPRPVQVLGERFVVWRGESGVVAAARDRCPHREAPLSIGTVQGGQLVCAYHGWSFDEVGTCVAIPSSGPGATIPSSAALDLLPVRERHGLVWMSPGRPTGEPPRIPEDDDRSYRRINAGTEVWRTSVTRMVDNFCDVAHFPWVHPVTLGVAVESRVAPISVEPLDAHFTGYRYSVEVDNAAGARVRQTMTTGFALPFTVRSTTHLESGPDAGSDRVLLLCSTPIDAVSSLFTFVVWRDADEGLDDGVDDEDQLAFDRAVGAEDRAMLERLPGELPLDAAATVNVQADRLSVEWRRQLRQLVRGGPGPGRPK